VEHVKNIMGNLWGIHWEHTKNVVGTPNTKKKIKIQPPFFGNPFCYLLFGCMCNIYFPHPFHLYGHLGVQIILFYFSPSSLPLWPFRVQA
jgi:hypothetical protein